MKRCADAKWIWDAQGNDLPNQYLECIHRFGRPVGSGRLRLLISADTNYVAWLNGVYLGSGQYSDWPTDKTYSTLSISDEMLQAHNSLAILAYYCGTNTYSYVKGMPRLWYCMEDAHGIFTASGTDSICRMSPAYRQGDMPRRSNQLGFVFDYDARRDDGWRSPEYKCPSEWRAPACIDGDPPTERPTSNLLVKSCRSGPILAQGVFKRSLQNAAIAEMMQTDWLSARRSDEVFGSSSEYTEITCLPATIRNNVFTLGGVYLVVELEQEECGYIDLEVCAKAGTILDIAVGEHLADLRVRAAIRGRHFASRYVCRDGVQSFTHFIDRYAGRYIQLHVTECDGDFTLHHIGLRPAEYPVAYAGRFACPDHLMNKIVEVGNRTVHLCMHEHYEDCPWREQAIYAADAHNQALTGYYAFAEYQFPRYSWALLLRGLRPDGYLEMCAPAKIKITIPFLTLLLIRNIGNQLLHAGDVDYVESCYESVRNILDQILAATEDTLLPSPTGEGFWNFYDWVHGMDCRDMTHPKHGGLRGKRYDAPLNLFLVLALHSLADMALALGQNDHALHYQERASEIATAVHGLFWSACDGAYRTYQGEQVPCEPHYAEETQALAVLSGAAPPAIASELCERLSSPENGLVQSSISQAYYKYEAILTARVDLATKVFDHIRSTWGKMLFAGATTFWETELGQRDFLHGGSLCHGWSGIPTYFAYAYILGIKPLKPGFAEFTVNPLINTCEAAEGRVPTPHGPIDVKWWRSAGSAVGELHHPSTIKPILNNAGGHVKWTLSPNDS
ncbi:MAG: hypothetical protein IT445_10300 [Phycisphaeraceae bacterium]|nr:hypothetical protein [Phycisphaeraceae bacterium]